MQTQRLITGVDLVDFFRQEVLAASSSVGVQLDAATEWYVVQLLCEQSHAGDGLTGVAAEAQREPLALVYSRACAAPHAERAKLLKALGDRALYVAGFFAESVERSLVDVDYYVTMGGRAYNDLSALLLHGHARTQGVQEVYRRLGRGFARYVDVLNQVASRSRGLSGNDADLLRLYERWVKTKSVRVKKMLQGRGLSVHEDDGGTGGH